MATMTEKDALIMLLEFQLRDLKREETPMEDYYVSFRDTYRFDISREEIEKFLHK